MSPLLRFIVLLLALAGCSRGTPAELDAGSKFDARTFADAMARSQAVIRSIACRGPDGTWYCEGAAPTTFRATATTPILPDQWSVPLWVADPQNSQGTSKDTNDCTTTSTACLHKQEILVHRLGCGMEKGCVRLRQATVWEVLSDDGNDSDPMPVVPMIENGASLVVKAPLPTASETGTLTTAPTPANVCVQPNVTFTGDTVFAPGVFMDVNHSGTHIRFWCADNAISGNCHSTWPLTAVTAPPTTFQTPAIWTVATGGAGTISAGDSFSAYSHLTRVNIPRIEPVIQNSTTSGGVQLYNIEIYDASGSPGTNPVIWGPGVTTYESSSSRIVSLVDGASNNDEGCVNCWGRGGVIGDRRQTGHYWHWIAGGFSSSAPAVNVSGLGVALDGWAMIPGGTFNYGVSMGLVEMGPGGPFTLTLGGTSTVLAAISPGYASVNNGVDLCNAATGNTLNVVQGGTLRYDPSHGNSAGVIASAGSQFSALQCNGSSTACSFVASGASTPWNCGITITTGAVMDNAADSTHFGGRIYGSNNGPMCMVGSVQ